MAPTSRYAIHWQWVILGGVLAAVLTLLAGLATARTASAVAVALANAVAFLLAGAITELVGRTARPRDPALGAALMAAIVGGVQAHSLRGRVAGLTDGRLLVSWITLVVLAWVLTWIGGRIGEQLPRAQRRRPAQP